MEAAFALLVALFFAAAVYLMTSRSLIRVLIGFVVFGNAINLLIFTAGRITRGAPPIIADAAETLGTGAANPLPQALVLTAIVISFAFFALLLVLVFRNYQDLGTDATDGPADAPEARPPVGY